MGQNTDENGTKPNQGVTGAVATVALLSLTLAIGLIARQQQRAIGVFAVGIYDRAFISTKFVDAAELAFQSYAAARQRPGADQAGARILLTQALDDLDVAVERSASPEFVVSAQAVRRGMAGLSVDPGTGPGLAARLQSTASALSHLSKQAWSAALKSRDKIDVFSAHADLLLLLSIGGSAILTFGIATLLRHAVQQRRRSLARMAHMAQHDTLTDLPNRRAFGEALRSALSQPGPEAGCAVLCIDLDRFKQVNDTLGHPIGDALLVAVAGRLRAAVRTTNMVARLGGDEFAVVAGFDGEPDPLAALAQRIITALSKPYEIAGHTLVIGASIGLATSLDAVDGDGLMRNADLALYRAKQDGRGTYRFFKPEMDAIAQSRRLMEMELRSAIERHEFELHYQPLISVDTGQVSLFEALVRWRHPQKGLLPPDSFIPLAEEVGLISAIDEQVLRMACREAATWPAQIGVAVNLSAKQFGRSRLPDRVRISLEESGLPASRLELEITERMLLEDSEATLATLHELRNLGVRISMDDFGTGYSSLSYLRSFPFDKLKIDRSFISGCGESSENAAIVRAIASMGRSLGIATTAEGVETREQMEQLVADGCTELQGYFFSRPRHPDDIPALLGDVGQRAA